METSTGKMKELNVISDKKNDFIIDRIVNHRKRNEGLLKVENIQNHLEQFQDLLIKNYIVLNHFKQILSLKEFTNNLEKKIIEHTLELTSGNQRRAASILGIRQTTLYEKIKRYGLKKEKLDFSNGQISKELTFFMLQIMEAQL